MSWQTSVCIGLFYLHNYFMSLINFKTKFLIPVFTDICDLKICFLWKLFGICDRDSERASRQTAPARPANLKMLCALDFFQLTGFLVQPVPLILTHNSQVAKKSNETGICFQLHWLDLDQELVSVQSCLRTELSPYRLLPSGNIHTYRCFV